MLALEIAVQIGQLALTTRSVSIGQHGRVLVQLVGHGLEFGGRVLQIAVALGKLSFQLGLRCLCRLRVAQDALGIDGGDTCFLRSGRQCKAGGGERSKSNRHAQAGQCYACGFHDECSH